MKTFDIYYRYTDDRTGESWVDKELCHAADIKEARAIAKSRIHGTAKIEKIEREVLRTKSALVDHVYDCALDVIENENYDIVNEGGFLDTDFANAAANIFRSMLTKDLAIRREPYSVFTMGYNWKFQNSKPCYISCSNDDSTGVSRSEACIFRRVLGLDEDDVKELLDMMNEAWFLMQNA